MDPQVPPYGRSPRQQPLRLARMIQALPQDAPVGIPQDPGSVASAAPDQETMVQVLAQQKKLDRNEGDNENAFQAEAKRIRAELATTCGN